LVDAYGRETRQQVFEEECCRRRRRVVSSANFASRRVCFDVWRVKDADEEREEASEDMWGAWVRLWMFREEGDEGLLRATYVDMVSWSVWRDVSKNVYRI